MIKRIKRLWKLSKKDPEMLERFSNLTEEEIALIPDIIEGDGKAEFFGEGTHKDYIEFEREQTGLKAWYDRIRNL